LIISLNLVSCVPTHNRVDLWRNLCTSLLYCVVRVRCRLKESSRLLSHLLMSFLYPGFRPQLIMLTTVHRPTSFARRRSIIIIGWQTCDLCW